MELPYSIESGARISHALETELVTILISRTVTVIDGVLKLSGDTYLQYYIFIAPVFHRDRSITDANLGDGGVPSEWR